MGPSREACDRCHAMKTRCVRSPRSQVCVRCTRLGFSCHYSPPGRTGRPAGSKQKRTTSRSTKASPSPRSSYEESTWCSTVPPCTGPTANPLQGQISPALTAVEDAASNSQLPVNLSELELELFGSESSFSDGANSMFFMDDLFQDIMHSNMTNASKHSTTPPSTASVSQGPLEHLFTDSSGPSSRHISVASMQEAEYVLLDAQGQLLNLVRALSSCSSFFPQDVEEIYRITDAFVKVVDDIATRLDTSSAASSCVTHMLLSSCYMSLIQAFERLVSLLRREQLGPKMDGFGPALGGITPAQTQMPVPAAAGNSANNVPFISVGSVRLPMSHQAVAEINLHLVGQAVQHLQASISRCAAKVVQPRLGMEDKGQSGASSSLIYAFTKMAMDELGQQESSLFAGLQMPALQ